MSANSKGKRVTVISTGIGTDNIEIFFTELDALINVDLKTREPRTRKKKLKIIRIGTSGSLQEDVPLGSHLISDYAVGFDNLMNFYNLEMTAFEEAIAKDIQKKTSISFTPYVVQVFFPVERTVRSGHGDREYHYSARFLCSSGSRNQDSIEVSQAVGRTQPVSHKASNFWLTNFEMETAGYYAMARLLGHEALSVNAIIANRAKNKFSKDPNKVVDSLIKKILERI